MKQYYFPGSRTLTDISERPLGFQCPHGCYKSVWVQSHFSSGFSTSQQPDLELLNLKGADGVCFLLLVFQHQSIGEEGQDPPLGHFLILSFWTRCLWCGGLREEEIGQTSLSLTILAVVLLAVLASLASSDEGLCLLSRSLSSPYTLFSSSCSNRIKGKSASLLLE